MEQTMKRGVSHDDGLDRLFAMLRAGPPSQPPPSLTERVLADAARVSAARARGPTAWPARFARLAALAELFGGWRGATALAGAAAIGFWTGFANADAVLDEHAAVEIGSLEAPVAEFFDLGQVAQ
jgi:hypothetical protein